MKIGILGNVNNPVTGRKNDPYSWFVLTFTQGLQLNGHNPVLIDYRSTSLKEVKNIIINNQIKILFTHLTFHTVRPLGQILQLYRDVKNQCGTKVIHISMDARRDDRYMGDLSDSFYMAFVGNYEMLERGKRAWKIPTYYTPYSSLCYDKMAKPVKDLSFKEPVFCGTSNSHPDRADFIRRLQQRIPIRIFRTQSGNDLRHRTPELSVSAKSILGLCTGYGVKLYTNVRPWQFLGTGACMIMRKFDSMDDIIPEDLYYPFDSYGNDGVEKVIEHHNKILKTDTMPMRERAFKFIQKYHSCKVRLRNILDCIMKNKEITIESYNYRNFI